MDLEDLEQNSRLCRVGQIRRGSNKGTNVYLRLYGMVALDDLDGGSSDLKP